MQSLLRSSANLLRPASPAPRSAFRHSYQSMIQFRYAQAKAGAGDAAAAAPPPLPAVPAAAAAVPAAASPKPAPTRRASQPPPRIQTLPKPKAGVKGRSKLSQAEMDSIMHGGFPE